MAICPTRLQIIDFLAYHLDSYELNRDCKEKGSPGYEHTKTFLQQWGSLEQVERGYWPLLLAIIKQLSVNAKISAKVNTDEMQILDAKLKERSRLFMSCMSFYEFVQTKPCYTLANKATVNMALIEFFLFPYLHRLLPQLTRIFPDNKLIMFLASYVELLSHPLDDPMQVFLSAHKENAKKWGVKVDFRYYKSHTYQRWATIKSEECIRENYECAFSWHVAGGLIHSLIGTVCDHKAKKPHPWYIHGSQVAQLKKEFDLLYNKKLSPFCMSDSNVCFESSREYLYKETWTINSAFLNAIKGYFSLEDFLLHNDGNLRAKKTSNSLEYLNSFCMQALNEQPSLDDVKTAEQKLKSLMMHHHLGKQASYFAWCIFIAKCKLDLLAKKNSIAFCEKILSESGNDYLALNRGIGSIMKEIKDLKFSYSGLYRLAYIGKYNQMVNEKEVKGAAINPFEDISKMFSDLIVTDEITPWRPGWFGVASINKTKIKSIRRGFGSFLAIEVKPQDKDKDKEEYKVPFRLSTLAKRYSVLMEVLHLEDPLFWLNMRQKREFISSFCKKIYCPPICRKCKLAQSELDSENKEGFISSRCKQSACPPICSKCRHPKVAVSTQEKGKSPRWPCKKMSCPPCCYECMYMPYEVNGAIKLNKVSAFAVKIKWY